MPLSSSTLAQLPPQVMRPSYPRQQLSAGIVHLGLGAFSRAHLLAYTEQVLNQQFDPRWGVVGVSLRSPQVHDALARQHHLYTLLTLAENTSFQVVGCLLDSLVAPADPQAVVRQMAAQTTRIVSLTITEKGYCRSPADGALLLDHPDIAHDLQHPEKPRTAVGCIAQALKIRYEQQLAPFTVLACDNLPHNGSSLRALVLAFVQALGDPCANWIAEQVPFPSTMVDRITPATTEENRQLLRRACGIDDAFPIVTEPFSQWVVEDTFAADRPHWEQAGVTFCQDVAPFERMKLALLNGTHSTLAYAGYPAGFDTVNACMQHRPLATLIEAMMREEIAPTLTLPPSVDLPAYQQQLLQRYRNPAIQHLTYQIAMDGSQKLPQRLLHALNDRLKQGQSFERLAFAVACWVHYLGGQREDGQSYQVQDPLADALQARLARAGGTAEERIAAMLAEDRVFPAELAAHPLVGQRLAHWLNLIQTQGPRAAVAQAATLP